MPRIQDYLAASTEHGLALRNAKSVVAQWDAGLKDAMEVRGVVVHEEAVAEILMRDLSTVDNPGV